MDLDDPGLAGTSTAPLWPRAVSYRPIQRPQGSTLAEWTWLGTPAGRARNKDKSADSGSYKHSWSHCSENRSLITHGQHPKTSQENWISAGWKFCFTRTHKKKAVCFNLFKTTTRLMTRRWRQQSPSPVIFLSKQLIYCSSPSFASVLTH